jgi:hypothetical protein
MHSSSLRIAALAWGLAALSLGPAGCEGSGIRATSTGSGVDRGKSLGELTSEEILALCTWTIDAQGGAGERACGFEGGTLSVNTVDQCISGFTGNMSRCQVALFEDCINSLYGDACQIFATSACKAYFDCVLTRD